MTSFESFEINIFPRNLKRSDVTPVYKAGDSTCKKNFRHVSALWRAKRENNTKLLFYTTKPIF